MKDTLAELRRVLISDEATWQERNILHVALGDSVTQGLTLNPAMVGDDAYHAVFRRKLIERFPLRTFSTINAGVGGDSTNNAMDRFESDVLVHHPNLLTICLGLNDCGKETAGLPGYKANLRMMAGWAEKAGMAVLFMTPNWMATRDSERVDPKFRANFPRYLELQVSGMLGQYVNAMRQVAADLNAPLADVYAEWQRRHDAGEDVDLMLSNGINHPDAAGHRLAGEVLFKTFIAAIEV